ncbi:hypothetical protein DM860_011330 [Cuscuta australis]|uniref:PWWP domain-containing protein n=1 Tax=Cuscuta australis TaxID=267555 RepID=A0A328DPK7_9ASTE|nr:hypothetical protein DM860_011330 [Cuscuta australis]
MESGSVVETLGGDGCVELTLGVEEESHSMGDDKLGDEPKEVSDERISLVVDVFGPGNGICQKGDDSSGQEHKFNVGDLVWVRTKSSLWWPGIVSDPSDETGPVLVKHFGNIISSRCPSSQLKPFINSFDQMLLQSSSRSFRGAVEKAVIEVGHCIHQEMSCSCFSPPKENKKPNYRGKVEFFSASEFDPTKFLEAIRLKAVDVSFPGGIEFAVMKNCLSAFYSSLGHKQLSVHKLRPRNEGSFGSDAKGSFGNDAKKEEELGDIGESSEERDEKSVDLRERKKSKYLSYPYVNSWNKKVSSTSQEGETGPKDPETESKKPVAKQSAGNLTARRTPRRKSRSFKSLYGTLESVGHSPLTEMVITLHSTARDCLYPMGSKDSVSALSFFYNFRKFSFLNKQVKEKSSEGNMSTTKGGKVQKKMKKKMEGSKTSPEIGVIHGLPDINGGGMRLSVENMEVTGPDTSRGKLKPMRAKNKGVVLEMGPHPVPNGGPQNEGSSLSWRAGPRKRKRMEEALLTTVGPAGIPDLNGKGLVDSSGGLASVGQPQQEKKRRRRSKSDTAGATLLLNFAPGHALPSKESLVATFMKFGEVSEPETQFTGESSARVVFMQRSDAEGACKSLETSGSLLGPALASVSMIPPPAKNAKPQKAAGATLLLNFAPGHPLPSKESLNETFMKWGPLVESETQFVTDSSARIVFAGSGCAEVACLGLQKSNPLGPALASYSLVPKPPRRKRTPKSPNVGPPAGGSTLLLSFFPGHPFPTKQSLISAFAKFGPVSEPATQFTSESTARVIFIRAGDAEAACKSLETSNPFGPALATFRVHCPALVINNAVVNKATAVGTPKHTVWPANSPILPVPLPRNGEGLNNAVANKATTMNNNNIGAHKNTVLPAGSPNLSGPPPRNGEGPVDIVYMKKNLEMMRSVLEKEGDNIDPGMKAKLESNIESFLKKLNAMAGSSSSSS